MRCGLEVRSAGWALLTLSLCLFFVGCRFDGASLEARQCRSSDECNVAGQSCIEGYCQDSPRECEAAEDCLERLGTIPPCQAASCSAEGVCGLTPQDEGAACGGGEGCLDAFCNGEGACVVMPNDARCDDELFCNGVERCNPTAPDADEEGCAAGEPPDLEDGVACTRGVCDEVADRVEQVCDGCACCGDDVSRCGGLTGACTQWVCGDAFVCQQVAVEEGTACDDGFACTTGDACDAEQNCSGQPDDARCDDTLFCNGQESCSPDTPGRDDEGCARGPSPVDDGIPCTEDSCDEDNDVVINDLTACVCERDIDCVATCRVGTCDGGLCLFEPAAEGASCDDGFVCTTDDVCDADQRCAGAPVDNACDNDLFCDGDERCAPAAQGADALGCVAGQRVIDDGVACTADSCDEDNDVVVNDPALCGCDEDSDCVATCFEGRCQDFECVFTAQAPGTACDDGVACTLNDACDVRQDCLGQRDDASCDDTLFCNGAEICDPESIERDGAGCAPGEPPSLDDGVACTEDVCDEDSDDILHTPVGCECVVDGDCVQACSVGRCEGFACVFTPAEAGTACDDDVVCTTADVCDEEGRCAGQPDNALCADEVFCNGEEICDPEAPERDADGCIAGVDPLFGAEDPVECEELVCDEVNDEVVAQPLDCCESEGPFYLARCFDGVDNDCDDLADAADPDCAFNPLIYGDLKAWLDAADRDTFDLSGDRVNRWNDKSPNDNDGTKEGILNNTLPDRNRTAPSGLPTVNFDGDNDRLDFDRESEFDARGALTVFVVFRSDGGNDEFEALLAKGDETWRIHRAGQSELLSFDVDSNDGSGYITTPFGVNDGAYHVVTATFNAGDQRIYLDGEPGQAAQLGSEINTNNDRLHIGNNGDFSSRRWDGKIAEVLIYLSPLNDEVRQQIEAYLALKWGL